MASSVSTQNQLLVAGVDFERILRSITGTRTAYPTGTITRNSFEHCTQWCVQSVTHHERAPVGADFGSMQDWFVADGRMRHTAAEYRDRFKPLPDQRLIVLTLAEAPQAGRWECVIIEGNTCRRVDCVRVVGASNLTLHRASGEQADAELDSERWSRLKNIFGEDDLRRLRNTHIMIFGASRNGSFAARELAALGVRKLTLVDPDVLEPHNYDAMLGGCLGDIGRPKVAALASELVRFRDDLAVTGLPWMATDRRVISRARAADVLMTCVDHGTPVLLASKMANRWNKVHVDLGTSVQHSDDGLEIHGDVRIFQPHQGCALCVGGISDRIDAEIQLQLPAGAQVIRQPRDFRAERAGSLVTINGITVSVAVQAVINSVIAPSHSCWHRISMTPQHAIRSIKVESAEGCKNCRLT